MGVSFSIHALEAVSSITLLYLGPAQIREGLQLETYCMEEASLPEIQIKDIIVSVT